MSPDTASPAPEGVTAAPLVPLHEPADGVPQVIETERELSLAARAVAGGEVAEVDLRIVAGGDRLGAEGADLAVGDGGGHGLVLGRWGRDRISGASTRARTA